MKTTKTKHPISKSIISLLLAVVLLCSSAFGLKAMAAENAAEASVSSAEDTAGEKAIAGLSDQEKNSSYGFFIWLSKQTKFDISEEAREDAALAARILDGSATDDDIFYVGTPSSGTMYINRTYEEEVEDTEFGAEWDATSRDLFYKSILFLQEGNDLRESEGAERLAVSSALMAMGELNANTLHGTLGGHTCVFSCGENSACSFFYKESFDPYEAWYAAEKQDYEQTGDTNGAGHYFNLIDQNHGLTGFGISVYETGDSSMGSYWGYYNQLFKAELYSIDLTRDNALDEYTYYNYAYYYFDHIIDGNPVEALFMTVTPGTVILTVGEQAKVEGSVYPIYVENQNVTWESGETSIATVDANGVITAKKVAKGEGGYPGVIYVTGTSEEGGFTASAMVGVLFTDVTDSSLYYFSPVYWAYNNDITTGKRGGERFAPGDTCTRAQIVTFLWRLAGEPDPGQIDQEFADVTDKSAYYYNAVYWAYNQGITTGRRGTNADGSVNFDPNGTCTRREIVTFLWRYAGKPAPESSESKFTDITLDANGNKPYYYDAVLWAVEKGITTGKAATNYTTFDPLGECTRGMSVTFLYRYAN